MLNIYLSHQACIAVYEYICMHDNLFILFLSQLCKHNGYNNPAIMDQNQMSINYLNYLWIAVAVLFFSVLPPLPDWYSSRLLSDKRRTDIKSAPHADAQTTVRLLPVVHENPLQ